MEKRKRHVVPILIIILSMIGNPSGYRSQPRQSYEAPPQYTGSYDGNGAVILCQRYEEGFVPCPEHRLEDNNHMKKYMELCLEQEDQEVSSCNFFPLQPPTQEERGMWSCHHSRTNEALVPCMLGFKIRHTTQQRRTGADDSYINVEFYAKMQPIPGSNNQSEYNVAQWIALGISPRDQRMGDDLVIYCHPYMDRDKFTFNGSDTMYPDDIGVAINKYFKEGDGKQAYDAERKFNNRLGKIKNGRVTYYEFPSSTPEEIRWSILECQASVSSYILLKSKTEISTGIDLDMEIVKNSYIFMAMGSCLHPKCLGDHPENSEELALIAKRTTPLAFHNRYWISNQTMMLYEAVERTAGVKLETNMIALLVTILIFYGVQIIT